MFIVNPFRFAATDYQPAGALMFDGAADTLSRTFSDSDGTEFIFSVWVKRTSFSDNDTIFAAGSSPNRDIYFFVSNKLYINLNDGSDAQLITSGVFRDPTAWFHILVSHHHGEGTASDRIKVYVNGVEPSLGTANYPSSSTYVGKFNENQVHYLGSNHGSGSENWFSGYMADPLFIDTKSIQEGDFAITDFGGLDSTTGIWMPKNVSTLSYSGNSFYLDLSNGSDIGNDVSGNNNDFTPSSMGAANHVTDSPSNNSDDGVGNYATLNPIATGSTGTFSNGNLTVTPGNLDGEIGTIGLSSGKWYWECTQNANGGEVGVYTASALLTTSGGGQANGAGSFDLNFNGRTHNNPIGGTLSTSSDYTQWAFASGDVIGVALDMDAGKIWFHKNGTYLQSGSGTSGNVGDPAAGSNEMMSGITTTVFPMVGDGTGVTANAQTINFGQSSFAHSAPSGFKTINTANLPEPTVTDPSAYFGTMTWTGNATARSMTSAASTAGAIEDASGAAWTPDFVWIKERNDSSDHALFDCLRSNGTRALRPSASGAEDTDATAVTDLISGGVALGDNSTGSNATNRSGGKTYAAWCLKAGGEPSADNTGDRTPTNNSVMKGGVAQTATDYLAAATKYPTRMSIAAHGGFSILTYGDCGGSSKTIPHGLSTSLPDAGKPGIVLVKSTSSRNWRMWHEDLTSERILYVDTDEPEANEPDSYGTVNTTIFTVDGGNGTSASGENHIAYCFARVPGMIGIGSYVGNGDADGTNVVIDDGGSGFKPAFLLVKSFKRNDGGTATGSWQIRDSIRNPYNPADLVAEPDTSRTESAAASQPCDFLSNGFKPRTTGTNVNGSGWHYIYLAFAESPFALNNRAR